MTFDQLVATINSPLMLAEWLYDAPQFRYYQICNECRSFRLVGSGRAGDPLLIDKGCETCGKPLDTGETWIPSRFL